MSIPEPRILAIDLRAQLLGFAVLEGPIVLLDWGRKPFRGRGVRTEYILVRKKIRKLLVFFAPSIIVLKYTSGSNDQEHMKQKHTVEMIKREATSRSIKLVLLQRRDLRNAFRQSGNIGKHSIAQLIVEAFPELAWKLPPNRKNWQPEHHNMPIFDAISLGIAYLRGQSGQQDIIG